MSVRKYVQCLCLSFEARRHPVLFILVDVIDLSEYLGLKICLAVCSSTIRLYCIRLQALLQAHSSHYVL